MKRPYLKLVLVLLAGLGGWRLYQAVFGPDKSGKNQKATAIVAVEITPVRRMTIEDAGLFTGSLLPRSQFVVAPKIAGRLEKVYVNIGDPVRYNQLIAEIDGEEYSQQLEKARADLEVSRANLEEARSSLEVTRREFDRVQPLHQKEIASDAELDAAQARFNAQSARLKVAEATLNETQAALREAEVRLAYTKIRASWEEDGRQGQTRVVGERFKDEGAMLTANTPIVSVLDINNLLAVIFIIERDYPKVQVGMDATVSTDAFPDKSFNGRIVRIAPMLKETSRQARVEIEVPNPEHLLKPGMFVRARIRFGEHQDALVVPAASLTRRNGRTGVFLADTVNLRASFVPVTTGIENSDLVELLDRSISGQVVTMGQHLLEDGAAITIPKPDRPESPAGGAR